MDDTIETTEVTFDLGLKDQLIINVASAVVGLIAGKLVEKAYIKGVSRIKLNQVATVEQ